MVKEAMKERYKKNLVASNMAERSGWLLVLTYSLNPEYNAWYK